MTTYPTPATETYAPSATTHRAAFARIPARWYEIIVCRTEQEALGIEGDLIYHHQPPYNRPDVGKRRYTGVAS